MQSIALVQSYKYKDKALKIIGNGRTKGSNTRPERTGKNAID